MYCKYCGEQIDGNSKFCNHCGKRLDSSSSGANINLPSVSLGNLEFNALMFSAIGFIVTVVLCFPTWISVRMPDLWSGTHIYTVSLFTLMDLFDDAINISKTIGSDASNALEGITIVSWAFIALESFILLMFFIAFHKKKRAAYSIGKIFSFLATIFSIFFSFIISAISSEFSEESYDIVHISLSVCPILIAIINIIAFIWLIIERRNLPDEEVDDQDDDEFENEDYDDDLTDDNANEFWEEMKENGYDYYKEILNKK